MSARKKQRASTESSSSKPIDYRAPDYAAIFESRHKRLIRLRADKKLLEATKVYYKTHPWDFMSDWGMTFDPRNLDAGLLSAFPFVLWPKQVDYVQWVFARWQSRERGLVEKSRDCGVTWLSVGFAATMWLFWSGFTCRFGSRKEELVDRRGDMDSIFEKLWFFLDNVPVCFMPEGFSESNRAHMRIINRENDSAITGEAGDNIGRGGRASIAFIDEAAFIEHQKAVDAALSQTTNCQIDISTPNGSGNPFYAKRMKFNNTDRVFIFDWRDDPRKNLAWYEKQKEEQDEATVAQEIDRDYEASAEGAFLPAKWVRSCVDAHKKLGIRAEGIRVTAFDPADTGDARAYANRHGIVITDARQKKDGDIRDAIPWAFEAADLHRADVFNYDADGMGAVAMKLALEDPARRERLRLSGISIMAYYGSGGVVNPGIAKGKKHQTGQKNPVDMFENFRAQSWTWVRERMLATHNAVTRAAQGQLVNIDPTTLISISSECKDLIQLMAELSRPERKFNRGTGKIMVESKAEMKARGVDSPNMADTVIMAFSVIKPTETPKALIVAPGFTPSDPSMGY